MNGRGAAARTLVVALALSVAPAADADAPTPRRYAAAGTVEIAFTPGDAVDNLIVAAIDRAQTEVLVHAYTFTHRKIAQALINARRRGVAVAVLADREQARAVPQNVLAQLASGGIEVWLDGNFAAAHNKVIIIDAGLPHATTITGSYNFTLAAQRSNAENIVVLHDNEPVARAYRDNWRRLKAGATPWSEDALK
ncbi:MAG: phospholipase D family protein [Betaproteobacteria bacterium]|nr:MAG: phospholipase D family protein [Betaproteobacteria bacterium]